MHSLRCDTKYHLPRTGEATFDRYQRGGRNAIKTEERSPLVEVVRAKRIVAYDASHVSPPTCANNPTLSRTMMAAGLRERVPNFRPEIIPPGL